MSSLMISKKFYKKNSYSKTKHYLLWHSSTKINSLEISILMNHPCFSKLLINQSTGLWKCIPLILKATLHSLYSSRACAGWCWAHNIGAVWERWCWKEHSHSSACCHPQGKGSLRWGAGHWLVRPLNTTYAGCWGTGCADHSWRVRHCWGMIVRWKWKCYITWLMLN